MEYIIESKIEDIYDIAFLNEVMSGAISDDKFEFWGLVYFKDLLISTRNGFPQAYYDFKPCIK